MLDPCTTPAPCIPARLRALPLLLLLLLLLVPRCCCCCCCWLPPPPRPRVQQRAP
jgi:hypothetical protein